MVFTVQLVKMACIVPRTATSMLQSANIRNKYSLDTSSLVSHVQTHIESVNGLKNEVYLKQQEQSHQMRKEDIREKSVSLKAQFIQQ